jgi:transposase
MNNVHLDKFSEARRLKGVEIANAFRFTKEKGTWIVPSMSSSRKYRVNYSPKSSFCTCPDFEATGEKCKHIYAVESQLTIKRPVGRPPKNASAQLVFVKKKTYPQNWRAYNPAQTREKDLFQKLLFNLCQGIEEIEQSKGRPRIPISDALFSICFKIYSKMSVCRFISDLNDAHTKGHLSKVSHFNTILNYLENPLVTERLLELIKISSLPFIEIESDFAVDSTGFTMSKYSKWMDRKHGSVAVQQNWIKLHFCCGVKSKVITAVDVSDEWSNDSPFFTGLVERTAENFEISEVSGDKAYTSSKNMLAVKKAGGTPYFAFKNNAVGLKGGIFKKMLHMFSLKRDLYLKHYHKRSNAETAVHMIKSKFGEPLLSKSDVAVRNEALCKVLCHNLCCVILAMHEMGINPSFGEGLGIEWEDVA